MIFYNQLVTLRGNHPYKSQVYATTAETKQGWGGG